MTSVDPGQGTRPAHHWTLRAWVPRTKQPLAATRTKGVRLRRAKDVPACARLLRVVHDQDRYPLEWPEGPRGWLTSGHVLEAWVAERQGEILGHVAVSPVGVEGVSRFRWRETTGRNPLELAGVTRLFVRPRVRGQGIGTALLAVATDEIRARGRLPVIEVVGTDARRLVEARGWRLVASDPIGGRRDRRRVNLYAAGPAHS
jgi:GNAT superfamily N-acetyltransferase